jgi:hypothetical protein
MGDEHRSGFNKVRHYVHEAASTTLSIIKLLAILAIGFVVLTIFPPQVIGGALNSPLVTQLLTLLYVVCTFATSLLVLILAAILTVLK